MRHDDEVFAVERKGSENLCGLDNIPTDIAMTVMEEKGASIRGILLILVSIFFYI